jgi:peptide/nickel transport system substrate-binding protein
MIRRGISRRAVIAGSAAGLGLAGAALVGFGRRDAVPSASPQKGGSIRIATQSSSTADTLDPAKGGSATDYVRHFMLYNGLTKNAPDLSAQLSLAEAIDSDDLVTWAIKLRRGVRFHDGSELTSADVVWSLQRHKDPLVASKVASVAEQFAEIREDGRHAVLLRLTHANADLPAILAQSQFLIIRNGEEKPDGNGTGPFRLADFRPGVRTVVVRNQEYWVPDRPRLERIELISIPDEVGRVNALLSGDVQLINAIDPRSSRRVEESPGHGLMTTRSGLYTNLIMRQDSLPTGNPHFVAAIQHLIDRDLVNRALFRNTATIANDHPIPPFHLGSRQGTLARRSRRSERRSAPRVRFSDREWLGRHGIDTAGVRLACGTEPGRQPRSGRRVLVDALDATSAELRQRQSSAHRRPGL